MPSSANVSSPVSRKFAWLVGAIVAAGLLWTGGWYFFAATIEDHLPLAARPERLAYILELKHSTALALPDGFPGLSSAARLTMFGTR